MYVCMYVYYTYISGNLYIYIYTWTLQILETCRNFRNLTYNNWFYPKHLDLLFQDFDCMFLGLVRRRPKRCLQPLKRPGENPQNPAKKPAKNPRKKTKTRKSWNLVILGIFGFFLGSKISSRCVYMDVVLRFSQKYIYIYVWNKVNYFWMIWPIFL